MLTRVPESTDFRYESTENHLKVLILKGFYGSGRRSRKFESCHLDQKREGESLDFPSLFLVRAAFSKLLCEANASSHTPPEDRQARLSGAGRGYHGAKRSYLVTSTTQGRPFGRPFCVWRGDRLKLRSRRRRKQVCLQT